MANVKLPIGRSGFEDIRKNGFYYIDKTGLLEEMLKNDGKQVTLITRPRRFGKTLGMSMMAEFLDIRKESMQLFEGLSIAGNQELCDAWMNQYPTVFVSFKDVDGLTYEDAYAKFRAIISNLFVSHFYLLNSDKLNTYERGEFDRIAGKIGSKEEFENSLLRLTEMLSAHYGKPVILLIDEYDVPLAKANANGYYKEMLSTVRGIMTVLKDNPALKFAVVTGCLQIAKESIFTGTNNLVSNTITDNRLDEYFGFTQAEVNRLLQDTGLTGHAGEIREWYDGYRFGDRDIYCPWDVMCHVDALQENPFQPPKSYWENTSHNDIIYQFISTTEAEINDKLETLLAGGYIIEPIEENLTYDVLHSSEENIWTLLYYTGYVTKGWGKELQEPLDQSMLALTIPNREIRNLFQKSVKQWFDDKMKLSDRSELFAALWRGDAQKLQILISDLLFDTISYHDYNESFYHAFVTGFLAGAGYKVESNYEYGLGRSDIVVKDRRNRRAAVIEAKIARSEGELEQECRDALAQITERQYADGIAHAGYKEVTAFGIAFYRKQCRVMKA